MSLADRSGLAGRAAARRCGVPSPAARRIGGIVLLLLLLAGTLAVILEGRRRQGLYWYDVGRDHRMALGGERSPRLAVEVGSGGFVVPPTDHRWDTAVLALEVESTLAGGWLEPFVELGGSATGDRQYVERRARGRRYLVLHRQDVQPGETLSLRGRHLRWPEQTAELLLFDNRQTSDDVLLVVAPHPDDAEIAAFGLYSSRDATVVTVTAGNNADGQYASLLDDAEGQDLLKGDLRTWDSLAVPLWGGVPSHRTANLGYLNGSLAALHGARSRPGSAPASEAPPPGRFRRGAIEQLVGGREADASWSSLVADFVALVDTVRPDVIVAPHPVLDAASDHQLTTIALLEALRSAAERHATLLLYNNHHLRSEYYPFGPSDSTVTLPPWFDEAPRVPSIFSFRLDEGERIRKLFALEAMHDLRGAPRRVLGGPLRRLSGRLSREWSDLAQDPLGQYSYYRRAVRRNELFFVHGPDERHWLAAEAPAGGDATGAGSRRY